MCCPASTSYTKEPLPAMKPSAWLNSEPLDAHDLKGKVALVYFFSFGEELSETAISHLSYMWSKMRGKGLMIIGVHTPSLKHEKGVEFVRGEVERLGITFPIAVDDDYQVWKAFHNQFYGQFHFIDHLGMLRHTRSGEGIEEEVEIAVVHLLNEAGKKVDLGPEIDGVCLEGDWYVGDGYVELEGASGNVDLRYVGDNLDLIVSSPKERRFELTLDGSAIPEGIAGEDVVLEKGKSFLVVGEEKRHQVVREERKVMREVLLRVRGKGFRLVGFCVDEI